MAIELVSTGEEIARTLNILLSRHDRVSFAVAWPSANTVVLQQLDQNTQGPPSKSRRRRDAHFQNSAFNLLQIKDHLKQIPRVRIAVRTEHAHQALG